MEIKYLNKQIAIWINDFLITRGNSFDFTFPRKWTVPTSRGRGVQR